MNQTELIGKIAARYLKNSINHETDGEAATFVIDCLSAEETVAVARAIMSDSELVSNVDIKLPRHFVSGFDLPEHILTDERATYHRNADCSKHAQLLCSTGDDETQSLNAISAIGAQQLFGHPSLWVKCICKEQCFPEETKKRWERALQGLMELNIRSLSLTARYVIETYKSMKEDGEPLVHALGIALFALKMPTSRHHFSSIRPEHQLHVSRWKTFYDNANKKKACFLNKQTTAQLLLGEEDLRNAYEKVKDHIIPKHYSAIENFINAPAGWNEHAAELSFCDWDEIEPLFSGLRRQKLSLGQATMKFYEDAYPEQLLQTDLEYLDLIDKTKRKQPNDEDIGFFDLHCNEIKEDRKLKSHWDRFIYGAARVSEDFVEGLLLVMEPFLSRAMEGHQYKLNIACDYKSKKSFRNLNVEAGLYFSTRYNGLAALLGESVKFDVGDLFRFQDLIKEWEKAGVKKNRSLSKSALTLKFTITMKGSNSDAPDLPPFQLEWKFNPNTPNSEFAGDFSRLAKNPLVFCSASREPVSTKGHYQPLNLDNIQSFAPVFGKKRGSFVAAYQRKFDLEEKWLFNLKEAESQFYISTDVANLLNSAFVSFRESYSNAITGFVFAGLSEKHLLIQYSKYATLLELVYKHAKGDINRKLILRPLLEIGTVKIEGGQSSLVAPWHPLRLAAMVAKASFATKLIKSFLKNERIEFGDTGSLFFRDLREVLAHPFYPELIIGWQSDEPSLLALTDSVGDYSLHEKPFSRRDHTSDDVHDNPKEGATQVSEMVSRYLKLHPHEQCNLSVILYNCDTATLAQAVVEKIRNLHEEDEELLCQVILRHRDKERLRELYEKIIEGADETSDSFNGSEETLDFMARLRIGIMADEAPAPKFDENRPEDIVFLQDVISRHSEMAWCEEDASPIEFDRLFPSRWSRRRPSTRHDLKSEVYLCCPAQTHEGWIFLTAVTSFIRGDWDGKCYLPVRQLNFLNNEIKSVLEETHNLGNWVVNFDELLDRRQLATQGVQVIRYKQTTTQGRNLIISSKAPVGLLRSMVLKRVEGLGLPLTEKSRHDLANRFIEDANEISGDLVLRAAKRGRSADELMGVVLSRFLITREIGLEHNLGVFFLDDYAEWLGKKEEQIADLLFLCPFWDGNQFHLVVRVTEAKFLQVDNLNSKRKEAQNQLKDTIKRIGDALFGKPERLDRALWLSRLSDLLMEGICVTPTNPIDLSACRRAIRDDACVISLRGYAHLFVKRDNSERDCSEFALVSKCEHDAYMEVFSPQKLRDIVLSYAEGKDPMPIRKINAHEDIWNEQTVARTPSPIKPSFLTEATALTESLQPQEKTEPLFTLELTQDTGKHPSIKISSSWAYPEVDVFFQTYRHQETDCFGEQEWLEQAEKKFRSALQQFQLRSKLILKLLTPNAAILKYEGSTNMTVDQIQKRQVQFLTTHGLDIINVIPEPGIVSVTIKRPDRRVLRVPDIWKSWRPDTEGGNHKLLIAIREENGEPLYFSPKSNAPHTLIAGETGSGKSVLMQNIILGIACTNTAKQAKITLIDPKGGVDYFALEKLPHLSDGIIDDCDSAKKIFDDLILEMDARYRLLKENRVSNIFEFNSKKPPEEAIPIHWVIHDEFAEWMMIEEYKKAVSNTVSRLATKARAAGIFLIFAAQRPDKDAMPMQLRANLGNRLILKVADEGTSEIALGAKNGGADKLLGRGHLAARLQNEDKELILAQVPLVENHELEELVSLMCH